MIGFSIFLFLSKFKERTAYLSLIVIIVITSVSAWPLFTGDMNGYYRPAEVPEDYVLINYYLAAEQAAVNSLWLPVFSTQQATWVNASTPLEAGAPTGVFALRSSSLPTYYYPNIYFFDYYNPIGQRWNHRPLDSFNGSLWGDVFAPLNIKYLIIHYDIDWPTNLKSIGFTNEWVKTIAEKLKSDETLKVIYEGEYLTAFEVKNTESLFTISFLALAQNGLPVHATLTPLTQNVSIIYSDGAVLSGNIMNFTDYILVGNAEDSLEQLQLLLANNKYLLQPTNFVEREIKPDVKWSYYTSSSDYSFQNQLRMKGIERWAWNFDYEKGFTATWASNATLKMPFNLENSDNYQIFIRYFQNQEGGEIQVHLDSESMNVSTEDQVNKFVWKELGTVNLEKGKHEVVLENTDGLNAINLFAIIPTEEVNKIEERVEDLIQDKRIIYILEAETDMYRENAPVSDKYDWQASNGGIELLTDASKVWSDLEIFNSGNYSIMIQCKGNLIVKLDDKDYAINVTDLELIDLDRITLDKGIHQLEITTLSSDVASYLDRIWIYPSQKENETLETLINPQEKPAEIIEFTKSSPTKYLVSINATEPFTLNFAQAYDPLWTADVNGEKINSIVLYSVINGFLINKTGELTITIEYEAQKWFFYGSVISITTTIISVVYLIWDLRKRRHVIG
jgi:hypothetical protein